MTTQLRKISCFEKSNEHRSAIHKLIPGGAHTYSKGDDQFPIRAPAAIVRGEGASVWDLDGNQYLDCSMGLTSVSLGHAYPPVVDRVRDELSRGCNFQRPSVIEREMAEAFLSVVPGHDRIKFAKNGSTATTAAVKLARAHTGRSLIAVPADHPFYSYDDWFIGQTACPKGIPEAIRSLTVPFDSKDLTSLERAFAQYPGQIACAISEPERIVPMAPNFLNEIIRICHQNGALFIQDEMITGYKHAFPGVIKNSGVVPDLATWGKGIANGFSFCALTGKAEIMDLGGILKSGDEKVFLISTTHGGETHAIAAALATFDVFKNERVVEHNQSLGKDLIERVRNVISKAGLSDYVSVVSCHWMPAFQFRNRDKVMCDGMRTLAMQEMIANGVLFQGVFVPCYSHGPRDVEYFVAAFEAMLTQYQKALELGFESVLIGAPAKPVFRRYL